jgi:hypothetical protein
LSLILITSFGAKAQTDTLFTDFIKLFPGQQIPPEFQSKFLKIKGPFPAQRLQFEQRYAKKIIKRTNDYILLSIRYHCGAGGMCESESLFSFELSGQLISTQIYSKSVGDCGFRDTIEPLVFNDNFFVLKIHEWEGDCNDETTEFETTQIKEYQIKESGQITLKKSQRIELRREFHKTSTELLDEEELNKLSREDLSTMRNELFAAYGYNFKTKKWSEYFKNTNWYIANTDYVPEDQLSFIEQRNLQLIKEIEKRKTPHNNGEHP